VILENWKFKKYNPGAGIQQQVFAPEFNDSTWLPIQAPGDVHSALFRAGVIPDPFYDRNEENLQWIAEKEWWYRTRFQADSLPLQNDERLVLLFQGLDTFTTIWLNGVEIGSTKNMFRGYQFDVGKLIKIGQTNTLTICFASPLAHIDSNIPFQSWGINPERISLRKAQFGFGWDWAPRFPTIGIYRPVELHRQKKAAFNGIHFTTEKLLPPNHTALLSLQIDIDNFMECCDLTTRYRLQDADGQIVKDDMICFPGHSGSTSQTVSFLLPDAKLWWTHDLGEPHLYRLTVELYSVQTLLTQQSSLVGIRTIELDQSVDMQEPGSRFFRFILNGTPIFAKGANWIPADSFPGRLTEQDYEKLLQAAREGNMNMLRVWGGGLYEHDAFYNLCDRMGLLVWQDFMFACAMYPETPPAFVQEVQAEAEYQVKRLRNHASLALWCGNNENQWIHEKEYWDRPD